MYPPALVPLAKTSMVLRSAPTSQVRNLSNLSGQTLPQMLLLLSLHKVQTLQLVVAVAA